MKFNTKLLRPSGSEAVLIRHKAIFNYESLVAKIILSIKNS